MQKSRHRCWSQDHEQGPDLGESFNAGTSPDVEGLLTVVCQSVARPIFMLEGHFGGGRVEWGAEQGKAERQREQSGGWEDGPADRCRETAERPQRDRQPVALQRKTQGDSGTVHTRTPVLLEGRRFAQGLRIKQMANAGHPYPSSASPPHRDSAVSHPLHLASSRPAATDPLCSSTCSRPWCCLSVYYHKLVSSPVREAERLQSCKE